MRNNFFNLPIQSQPVLVPAKLVKQAKQN